MSDIPSNSDEQMADALDGASKRSKAGRPFDREELLARYPDLAEPLKALEQLFIPSTITNRDRPPVLALSCPLQIGPYRVVREIGSGGFGVVYLAFDPDVKRQVAIKVLHPGRIDQPEALARFQREAHATGRLHHPGIVQLFDYSRQGPPYYIVTEYVEGIEPRALVPGSRRHAHHDRRADCPHRRRRRICPSGRRLSPRSQAG